MTIKARGKPNYQRLAETMVSLLAARDGMDIVPGSVKIELRDDRKGEGEHK